MDRITYLFKRIIGMDYGRLFRVVGEVHERSGRNRIVLFFDIIYCGFKYQAGYVDYLDFELFNVPNKKRSTFVTRGVNNEYVKALNDMDASKRLENKLLFHEDFKDFTGREWLDIREVDLDTLDAFIKKHGRIIAKPLDGISGKGINFYSYEDMPIQKMFDEMMENKTYLLEELIQQHHELQRIHPNSVNTIRVVTIQINGHVSIPFACLRTGNGNEVDNLNSGGFAARIDLETGIIETRGVGKYNRVSDVHPVTGVQFLGFQVPLFEEVKEFAKKAALQVPNMGLVGWDVAITEKGPVLVEGNEFPGHDIYQSPEFVGESKTGIRPLFDQTIETLRSMN